MVVQVTMMKFNREKIDGAFLGKSGEIEAPLFQYVDTKIVKGVRTPQYQIDVYGKEWGKERVWICECKYTRTKMGAARMEKLENAGQALKREVADAGLPVPEVVMWLVSTGGFTGELLERAKDREDTYCSDFDGINGIFQAYGGNYRIPVFKES